MQRVSNEYAESMKSPLRNRGYIRVTVGIVNNAAMSSAQVAVALDDMSDAEATLNGVPVTQPYAVTDQDFTKIDGSMYFAPPTGKGNYNQGMVTNAYPGVIWLVFNNAYDIRGLTINFGDYFPTGFTIKTNNIESRAYTNDGPTFITEDIFEETTFFEIRPTAMAYGIGRFRINGFATGVADTFSNEKVISSNKKEYVSPIAESVPSIDASVVIDNQDLRYSVDNPDSALAYMEAGQELKIQYGYDVTGNGDIEWLKPRVLYLSEWSANDKEATFSGVDRFTQLGETYYGGRYYPNGINAYTLAWNVLNDAGLTVNDCNIDPHLLSILLKNAIPPCTHAEALQMIANACRAILYVDSDNKIAIRTTFEPEMNIYSNGEADWSDVTAIGNRTPKDAYAMSSRNFTPVDGTLYFEGDPDTKYVGYTSEELAGGGYRLYFDEYGHLIWEDDNDTDIDFDIGSSGVLTVTADNAQDFTLNSEGHVIQDGFVPGTGPTVTIELNSYYNAYGVGINFREQHPSIICIRTYDQTTLLDEVFYDVEQNEFQTTDVFYDFDKMIIEFVEGYPYGAVTVDNVWFGDATDYRITRAWDLTGAPTGARQQKVKQIKVQRTTWKLASSTTTVASEEIEQSELDNGRYTFYFSVPTRDLSISVQSGASSATITSSSHYYATVQFSGVTGTIECTMTGKEYRSTEKFYKKSYRSNGTEIVWKNPLIHSVAMAEDVEEWLSSYYLGDVEYEVPWRGDPRTEASDLFWLELKDRDDVLIQSYEDTLSFNGAWSGTIKARKKVQ